LETVAHNVARSYPRLAEYGQVQAGNWPRANVTVLEEAWSEQARALVSLVTCTAGYEPAGSAMRWTGAFSAVWWDREGARQGQRFLELAAARERFAYLTVRS
jgi:hypothetical protein